jgi:hypothetical protein
MTLKVDCPSRLFQQFQQSVPARAFGHGCRDVLASLTFSGKGVDVVDELVGEIYMYPHVVRPSGTPR